MKAIRFALVLATGVLTSLLQADVTLNDRTVVTTPVEAGVVSGDGALVVDGTGTASVEMGPGESGRLFVQDAVVEISGRTENEDVAELLSEAYLHLDATESNTMTLEEKDDGYQHVTVWRDVNGGANAAVADSYKGTGNYVPECNTPFLSDVSVSPSGLPMVDFGDGSGPLYCLLKFTAAFDNARELFWVGQHLGGSGVCVFGGKKQYYFEGGENNVIFSNDAKALSDPVHGVCEGDIRLNNQPCAYNGVVGTRYGNNLSSVYVASAGFPDNYSGASVIELLGSGRYIKARTGKLRLGEVIVFTRTLTAAERTRINDYLMKKWLKDAATEFGAAVVGSATASASLSVPEGQVAKIDRIAAESGTLVKAGAGTLEIGALTPSTARVEVQDGVVRFEPAQTVSTLAPAEDPYLWLDADKAESIVTNKIDYSHSEAMDPNKYYVTRWNDCRGAGHDVYAEVPQQSEWAGFIYKEEYWFQENFPWVDAGPNKHNVVHFGSYASQASWMWLQPHNKANAYEGFIVARHASTTYGRNFFGSSNTDLLRGTSFVNKLIDPQNANAAALAALWLFDGKVRDPILDNVENNDNVSFHVVSFASSAKLRADLLAKDRLYANGGPGGVIIGEVILYDRKLTSEERLATTAYLMKKWRNEDVPEANMGAAAHPVVYAETTPIVVDTDEDCTLSNISGGNGAFVKRGTGSVTVPVTDALPALESLSADGGTLAVDFSAEEKALLRSLQSVTIFDFDAMDAASFSNEVAEAGARTNVIAWADTLRKGVVAYSARVADNTSLVPADGTSSITQPATEHPQLVSVKMPDGKCRPTVDFGTEIGVAKTPAGAGMQLNAITAQQVREVHTIFADNGSDKRGIIVGCRKDLSGVGYAFQRADWSGALFSSIAAADVKNGYVAVDRDAESYSGENATTEVLPSGFHLISYAPLSAQRIGSLAMDRNSRCGGCRISEQIAFSRALSDDERSTLQKYLMAKWGLVSKERVADLAHLSVVSDARLDLGDATVAANVLSGGGTITAAEVDGVSKLEISGAVDTLTVKGEVTFADVVTVELTGKVRKLGAGIYEIFAADAIANEGLIAFTVTGDELNPNRTYAAYRDGNSIFLKVEKKGLCVIIK